MGSEMCIRDRDKTIAASINRKLVMSSKLKREVTPNKNRINAIIDARILSRVEVVLFFIIMILYSQSQRVGFLYKRGVGLISLLLGEVLVYPRHK